MTAPRKQGQIIVTPDEVVAPEELHPRAMALAAEVARGPLVSQGLTKKAIDDGLSTSLAAGLLGEQALFVEAFGTDDSQIGVKSFLEKRLPEFEMKVSQDMPDFFPWWRQRSFEE